MYKLLVGCHLIVIEKKETEAPRARIVGLEDGKST
jgi:hypothetical protein